MDLHNKHIVITGGTSGIGLGIAKALLDLDNEVLIVGSNQEKIDSILSNEPRLQALQADLRDAKQRENLIKDVLTKFPKFDMLINDAGIHRYANLKNPPKDWSYYQQELAINLEAPMHLTILSLEHLLTQYNPAIVNVSSGLVITPGVWAPFHTASKSGLHGFTEALRLQLEDTSAKVFEVFPPAVDTDNSGFGTSVDKFVPAIIEQLQNDDQRITFGITNRQLNATKEENEIQTKKVWDKFKDDPDFLQS